LAMSFSTNFPENMKPNIRKSIANWNRRFPSDLIVLNNRETPPSSLGDVEANVIYWDDTDKATTGFYDENDMGFADLETVVETNEYDHVDIHINALYYRYYELSARPKKDEVNLEDVMNHELGHALGLEHTPRGTMAATFQAASHTDGAITADAITAVHCLYGF
jgi:predicted Zn-dependent protease